MRYNNKKLGETLVFEPLPGRRSWRPPCAWWGPSPGADASGCQGVPSTSRTSPPPACASISVKKWKKKYKIDEGPSIKYIRTGWCLSQCLCINKNITSQNCVKGEAKGVKGGGSKSGGGYKGLHALDEGLLQVQAHQAAWVHQVHLVHPPRLLVPVFLWKSKRIITFSITLENNCITILISW